MYESEQYLRELYLFLCVVSDCQNNKMKEIKGKYTNKGY